jgi:hypothetical protein
MANTIVKAQDLALAKDDLENRCVLKLHCGQSYKAIERDLGLTAAQIGRIVRERNVHAWTFRNGNGPMGSQVSSFTTDAPAHNIGTMIKLFSAKAVKAIL